MLVIHAHWRPPRRNNELGSLFFWAESSDAEEPFYFKGRLPKRHPPKEHGFALSAQELRERIAVGTPLAGAADEVCKLRIPSTRTGPMPSPRLAHNWNLDTTTPYFFAPWLIQGLELTSEKAFGVLVSLPEQGPNHSYVLGNDALYWRRVANFVLEVLAAQKVVPVLEEIEGGQDHYQAVWQPVLDGENDGERLMRLAAAMPPVCLVEMLHPNGRYSTGSDPTPQMMLGSFITTMCDKLMRAWGRSVSPKFERRGENPFQSWIKALFSDDNVVRASTAQLDALQSSLNAWMRDLKASGDDNFRIAFRMEAPQESLGVRVDGEWRLSFHLQSRHETSLLVGADEVWHLSEPVMELNGRRMEYPQEKLLAGLGYAARLYTPLMDGLQTSQPGHITLTTESAYSFMRQAATLLKQAGFGIVAPPWWDQQSAKLGIRLHISPRQKSIPKSTDGSLSLDKLVSYRWEMALGGTSISRQEFETLVAMKSPLVQVHGQWIQLDQEQIDAANRFWDRQRHSGTMNLIEVAQYGLNGTGGMSNDLPINEVIADDWVNDWLEDLSHHDRVVTLEQPASMLGKLRPYQVQGYSWLAFFQKWGLGACLADDMGLGKTIQTLALLLHEKESKQLTGPVLLVCPTSVVTNWRHEVERFTPSLRAMVHQGPKRLKGKTFQQVLANVDLVLTSYAVARQDIEMLRDVDWHSVVLDEAHNIKNPNAKQSRAVRTLKSNYRLALTGTPVENRLSELWSILHFLNPGYLYTREEFRKRFAMPIERFGDQEATERLRRLVSPFILRRLKTDPNVISDLPEKIEMKEYCTLNEEQAALYEATVQQTMQQVAESDGMARRGLVLKLLMQLKQICNHPVQFEHRIDEAIQQRSMITNRSGKLSRLEERLETILAQGERVLVFTQFASMGRLLTHYLPERMGYSVQFLHGGTPAWQREEMVRHFQEDAQGPQIFILSLKAGGTGLNLTRASHVIHFDRWWNPAVEDQATDRAFRIGQKNNVQVRKFITAGTLEERIDDMIEAKKGLADAVIGSGEQWLTELSTEELRQLVQLRL
ncbi:MAG: DEAD/DEAH box helicase [Anaerolineae bacterium]|nr:DEAD/DEAH box helicase [Anaerolineae bacterium]